jgi:hypothetical protein
VNSGPRVASGGRNNGPTVVNGGRNAAEGNMAFGRKSKTRKENGPFRFRVSDALAVPLRGYLLRLRLLEGVPALEDVSPGRKLNLRSPEGAVRTVSIKDLSITGGEMTQERLERNGMLDVVISQPEASDGGEWIDIGWEASGPVNDASGA